MYFFMFSAAPLQSSLWCKYDKHISHNTELLFKMHMHEVKRCTDNALDGKLRYSVGVPV